MFLIHTVLFKYRSLWLTIFVYKNCSSNGFFFIFTLTGKKKVFLQHPTPFKYGRFVKFSWHWIDCKLFTIYWRLCCHSGILISILLIKVSPKSAKLYTSEKFQDPEIAVSNTHEIYTYAHIQLGNGHFYGCIFCQVVFSGGGGVALKVNDLPDVRPLRVCFWGLSSAL